jgi:hypothetical protein
MQSRLLACPRLSREREAERQRAIQRPLAVNWREKVEEDGQIYISISSDEEEEGEDEEAHAEAPREAKKEPQRYEPEIVTIDSSSDEEEEEDTPYEAPEEEETPYEAPEEKEEAPARVKRKLEVLELDEKEEELEDVVEDVEKKHKPQRQVATREHVEWETLHVPGVRKRRLGEEDAAFLLFYGERETPGADILRLIIRT